MKKVKFSKSLPTVPPGRRQVVSVCFDCGSTKPGHHTKLCDLAPKSAKRDLPSIPGTQWWVGRCLAQTDLDERIRAALLGSSVAVEEMVQESKAKQTYQLSDGRLLVIFKSTGRVEFGGTTNRETTVEKKLAEVKALHKGGVFANYHLALADKPNTFRVWKGSHELKARFDGGVLTYRDKDGFLWAVRMRKGKVEHINPSKW